MRPEFAGIPWRGFLLPSEQPSARSQPAQQRLWRHDRGHLGQEFPSQSSGFGRQPTPLIIRKPQTSFAQLLAKDTVLLAQVLDHLKLTFIHPAGDSDEYKPKWIQNGWHYVV
jgi:hypothetical protein